MRSAARQTFVASATSVAPAARYSSSVKPAVRPADFWMSTFAPSETQRRQRLGVIETRVSPILISFGTPIVISAETHETHERFFQLFVHFVIQSLTKSARHQRLFPIHFADLEPCRCAR